MRKRYRVIRDVAAIAILGSVVAGAMVLACGAGAWWLAGWLAWIP